MIWGGGATSGDLGRRGTSGHMRRRGKICHVICLKVTMAMLDSTLVCFWGCMCDIVFSY